MEQNIQEKYTNLLNELYRSFDFFNEFFCQGKLNKPIITTQGEKRKGKTWGWFGKDFWTEHSGEEHNKLNEINLTAESLHREPNAVLCTLLHEMAHLKNSQEGIFDCTTTQYHNKEFKKTAEFFGLIVEKMKARGWATTTLGEKALGAIELLKPDVSLYKIVRTPPYKLAKDPTVINLNVSLDYEDKVEYLTSRYGKKREMTEAAIDMLYQHEKSPKPEYV